VTEEEIMTVNELIRLVREEGSHLARPVEVKGMPPMTFVCSLADRPATKSEMSILPAGCPPELREFWSEVATARLFEDKEYGQWGLEILDPIKSVEATERFQRERQRESVYGDLVVGQFLGDSDVLIVRCDPNCTDFGNALIALPLDPRVDWDVVGISFGAFLERYVTSGGEKFWTK
jgi:hypothetical protein